VGSRSIVCTLRAYLRGVRWRCVGCGVWVAAVGGVGGGAWRGRGRRAGNSRRWAAGGGVQGWPRRWAACRGGWRALGRGPLWAAGHRGASCGGAWSPLLSCRRLPQAHGVVGQRGPNRPGSCGAPVLQVAPGPSGAPAAGHGAPAAPRLPQLLPLQAAAAASAAAARRPRPRRGAVAVVGRGCQAGQGAVGGVRLLPPLRQLQPGQLRCHVQCAAASALPAAAPCRAELPASRVVEAGQPAAAAAAASWPRAAAVKGALSVPPPLEAARRLAPPPGAAVGAAAAVAGHSVRQHGQAWQQRQQQCPGAALPRRPGGQQQLQPAAARQLRAPAPGQPDAAVVAQLLEPRQAQQAECSARDVPPDQQPQGLQVGQGQQQPHVRVLRPGGGGRR
jgi:hypothetical protein